MNNDPSLNSQPSAAPKPVAYDSEGRPLYAAPPAYPAEQPVQAVHFTRPIEPAKLEIPEDVKQRHDESVAAFPFLNLSESEYVVSAVRRHPIGLFIPVAITVLLVAVMLALIVSLPTMMAGIGMASSINLGPLFFGGALLIVLFLIGGYISIWVYTNNRFFLTNESVIQEIQQSLFAHNEQTVSLENIEDASYEQRGILQTMFNYGSIRLSTEGDETTYRFSYVAEPKKQIAILNNAVEAFKNGRPVDRME